MPGTVGSLGGLLVYFLVKDNTVLYAFSLLFLLLLGMMFTAEAERVYKRKDPQMIVIDEAAGMMIALFLVPYSWQAVVIGFLLFRFFDIIKVFPARRIEKVSGAFGIMFDDIIAAAYTNIILQLAARYFCLF
jgi:phosphatidylglycerophosphatase A